MATVTIGSNSRNQPNPQAWWNAILAVLLANERGECYNDTEFSISTGMTFSGVTVGAFTIVFTAATGQSFMDHASVRTNALRYNQANGVGLLASGSLDMLTITNAAVTVSRLQFRKTSTSNYSGSGILFNGGATNGVIRDSIVEHTNNAGVGQIALSDTGSVCKAINCLFISRTGGKIATCGGGNNHQFINCTMVTPADITPTNESIVNTYSSLVLTSCALFGWTALRSGSGSFDTTNSKNNASDLTGLPGSGSFINYGMGNVFVNPNVTAGTHDFRLRPGSNLYGTGFLDSTNAPLDITGFTRPASPSIGCHQPDAPAAVTFNINYKPFPLQMMRR